MFERFPDLHALRVAAADYSLAHAAALAPVNTLSEALTAQWESRSAEYLERCKTSPIWLGEVGMR